MNDWKVEIDDNGYRVSGHIVFNLNSQKHPVGLSPTQLVDLAKEMWHKDKITHKEMGSMPNTLERAIVFITTMGFQLSLEFDGTLLDNDENDILYG